MSAFLVADRTINRVVTRLESGKSQWKSTRKEIAEACECEPYDPDFTGKVALSMYLLNVEAVRGRYQDADATGMVQNFAGFHFEPADDVEVLKSLCCWLYQCTETNQHGELLTNTGLYLAFRDLQRVLACEIVSRSAAWERADWE